MPNNSYPGTDSATPSMRQSLFSPYTTPIPFAPFPHEPQLCSCDQCVATRLYRRMDLRSSPLEVPGSNAAPNIRLDRQEIKTSRRSSVRRSDSDFQPRHHNSPPLVVPLPQHHHHPEMAYPEIYIYPKKSHITFPVVNYSAASRAQNRSSCPVCYLAISPEFAEPTDFEEALSPPGSGLAVVARLSKTQKTAPLRMFRDAAELRKESIQLEVWDESAIKVPGKDYGIDTETDVPNSTEAESSKKKRIGNPVQAK